MTSSTNQPSFFKTLWAKCLFGSFFLHALCLYIVTEYPSLLSHTFPSLFSSSKPHPLFVSLEDTPLQDDTLLSEAFEELVARKVPDESSEFLWHTLTSHFSPSPEDDTAPFSSNVSPLLSLSVKDTEEDLIEGFVFAAETSPNSLPLMEKSAAVNPYDDDASMKLISHTEIPKLALEGTIDSASLEEGFAIEDNSYAPSQELDHHLDFTKNLSPAAPTVTQLQLERNLPKQVTSSFVTASCDTNPPLAYPSDLHDPFAHSIHTTYLIPDFTPIDQYLPEQTVASVFWNDSFEIKTHVFPDDQGYVFSLSLSPKQDLKSERMGHTLYFLIDTSTSIEKHKLAVFKRSVLKALSTLSIGDSFNIFYLDKKVTKLSPQNLPYSLKSIHMAEDFLEKSRISLLPSSIHLYQCLKNIVEGINEDGQVHTAILLTNGRSSLNFQNQQKQLAEYLEKNNGKLNVYTAAVGQNNNLVCLDMISSLSGGKLLYSDTNASFPRKLTNFVKTLLSPLAKDILLNVRASDPKASFTLLPVAPQLPNLYNNEPFIIMGKIDRLCDLSVTIQGKHDDEWVYIQKTIHFDDAQKADAFLKKEWRVRLATEHYDHFLKDAKGKHLSAAKEILKTAYGKAVGE